MREGYGRGEKKGLECHGKQRLEEGGRYRLCSVLVVDGRDEKKVELFVFGN